MWENGDKMVTKNSHFSCSNCGIICAKKYQYEKHCRTAKHIYMVTNGDKFSHTEKNASNATFVCYCGNKYVFRQGLSRHKKNCPFSKKGKEEKLVDVVDKSMVMELLKQNGELQKQILELAYKPTIVHNNTKNILNKQFNLNIFLNETCKNAMNLSDFVSSLVIKNEEFENMGKLGYVQGISNILIRGLKELDETKRPLHCTDRKRETIYIKENNVWNKEFSREKIKQLVLDVSFKNVRKIPAWKADHPGCDDTSSNKYMDYVQILNQVMTGIHPDSEGDIDKIIRNVSLSVVVDKGSTL
jgi:hypothetical protein